MEMEALMVHSWVSLVLTDEFMSVIFQMTFGEQNTEKEAHEQLAYAFEHGINALDTAEAVSSFVFFSSASFKLHTQSQAKQKGEKF